MHLTPAFSRFHPYRIPILASSGKLDKKVLPAVDKTQTVDAEGLPSTDTERQLLPLWADVLQLQCVDVHESFFDLGGCVRVLYEGFKRPGHEYITC